MISFGPLPERLAGHACVPFRLRMRFSSPEYPHYCERCDPRDPRPMTTCGNAWERWNETWSISRLFHVEIFLEQFPFSAAAGWHKPNLNSRGKLAEYRRLTKFKFGVIEEKLLAIR